MEALPESVATLYSDAYIIDSAGKRVYEQPETTPPVSMLFDEGAPDVTGKLKKFISMHHSFPDGPPSGNLWLQLIKGNFIPAMSCLWRVAALRDVGGPDLSLHFDDYDLLLRLARKYTFHYSGFISVEYRMHAAQMTKKGRSTAWQESAIKLLAKHANINAEADSYIKKELDWMVIDLSIRDKEAGKRNYAVYNQLYPGANKTLGVAVRTGLPYWRLVQLRRLFVR